MVQHGKPDPRTPDPEELSLRQRIGKKEKEAFDVLVKKFSGRIYRQAFLILGSPREVEDAVQEVFVKAYLAMGQYRGGSLFSWLATITHHHCIDLLRKSNQEVPKVENPPEHLLSVTPRTEIGEGAAVGEILAKLDQSEREVVHLRVIEGLDYSEVSEITGLAEGSLRNILYRSMRKLREAGEKS